MNTYVNANEYIYVFVSDLFLQILIMAFKDVVCVWLIFTNVNCEIQMCCIYNLLVIFIAVYYFIILIYIHSSIEGPSLLVFGYSK